MITEKHFKPCSLIVLYYLIEHPEMINVYYISRELNITYSYLTDIINFYIENKILTKTKIGRTNHLKFTAKGLYLANSIKEFYMTFNDIMDYKNTFKK